MENLSMYQQKEVKKIMDELTSLIAKTKFPECTIRFERFFYAAGSPALTFEITLNNEVNDFEETKKSAYYLLRKVQETSAFVISGLLRETRDQTIRQVAYIVV